MAGAAQNSQRSLRSARRVRRADADTPAVARDAAPRKRTPARAPRRSTLDARALDWWKQQPSRLRLGYRGAAVLSVALLVGMGLAERTQTNSAVGFTGTLAYTLAGWGSYPFTGLLALIGLAWIAESVTDRDVLRRFFTAEALALWCLLLASSHYLLGRDVGGLAGMLLALPLAALPDGLTRLLMVALALVLLLALAQVAPRDVARLGRSAGRRAGVGLRAGGRRLPRISAFLRRTLPHRRRHAGADGEKDDFDGDGELDDLVGLPMTAARAARLRSANVPPHAPDGDGDGDADDGEAPISGFPGDDGILISWNLPPLDLLDPPPPPQPAGTEHVEELAQRLEHALRSFRVDVEVRREDICVGPTIIRFGIRPIERPKRDDRGRILIGDDGQPVLVRTRVSRILNLRHDLALALEAHSLRMEAPVPGQPYVGLEIPRPNSNMVMLREILLSEDFQKVLETSKLAVALGRDVAGRARAADISRFPHVLVAGATGAGKSVALNGFLASILTTATPDDVRLVLVDPKKVELTVYNGIPHLLTPVITDVKEVAGVLKQTLDEMDRRYQLFAQLGVRNLEGYRHLARQEPELEQLPNIVLVIDELADLMMAAPDEVEYLICRLAQLARATGLHLVVATQRPSVDVITGLIKANIPTRIAFMVSSMVDSRTILDMGGAEHLLGRGDMLFMPADASKPERIQGSFVSDEEVSRLVRFWRQQARRAQAQRRRGESADFAHAEQARVRADGGQAARVRAANRHEPVEAGSPEALLAQLLLADALPDALGSLADGTDDLLMLAPGATLPALPPLPLRADSPTVGAAGAPTSAALDPSVPDYWPAGDAPPTTFVARSGLAASDPRDPSNPRGDPTEPPAPGWRVRAPFAYVRPDR